MCGNYEHICKVSLGKKFHFPVGGSISRPGFFDLSIFSGAERFVKFYFGFDLKNK